MTRQMYYGGVAKALHWLIVALLLVQFPLGWFMPDIRRGMQPGDAMMVHISIGLVILTVVVVRLIWRLSHPVAPDGSLPHWQNMLGESVHWLLYLLLFATTLSGWAFASLRGWSIQVFNLFKLPMLASEGSAWAGAVGRQHENLELALITVVTLHVLAALVHAFVYRDKVLQRMLPGA